MTYVEQESDEKWAYWISACLGKEKFDRATANLVARKTRKVALVAYRCRCCGHWHVGHDQKKRKARAPRNGR